MLSNERDMLWPGLDDPPLVRSEVAFCPVSMSTSFDPASGTSLVVVRVSDVVFAAFDGGDDVDNVGSLGCERLDAVERGSLDGRRKKKDVSF